MERLLIVHALILFHSIVGIFLAIHELLEGRGHKEGSILILATTYLTILTIARVR